MGSAADKIEDFGRKTGISKIVQIADPIGTAAGKILPPGVARLTGMPGAIATESENAATARSKLVAESTPGVPPPPVMPVPGQDDLANIRARRLSIQAQLARRGRLSTILSQMRFEPLGGST